jgi:hypothetical protein
VVLIKPLGEDFTPENTPGTVKPVPVSLVEPVAYPLSYVVFGYLNSTTKGQRRGIERQLKPALAAADLAEKPADMSETVPETLRMAALFAEDMEPHNRVGRNPLRTDASITTPILTFGQCCPIAAKRAHTRSRRHRCNVVVILKHFRLTSVER